MAFARILVTTPVEATDERVAAATTFTERDQLAARVRGEMLPTAADLERFPAEWQELSLSTRPPLRLEANDCDLLRDMSEQVFPKLGVRLEDRVRCIDTATHMKPEVRVKALLPVVPSVVAAMSLVEFTTTPPSFTMSCPPPEPFKALSSLSSRIRMPLPCEKFLTRATERTMTGRSAVPHNREKARGCW